MSRLAVRHASALDKMGCARGWRMLLVAVIAGMNCAGAIATSVAQDPTPPTSELPTPERPGEPSGLQVLVALEDVLVDVIARAEKSVVSIARVKKEEPASLLGPQFPPIPFRDQGDPSNQEDNPTNPDFIPNEFGTGVVVDPAGLILTNFHVLISPAELAELRDANQDLGAVLRERFSYFVTTVDRRPYEVLQIVAADPRSDLAVLRIDAEDLPPITFGDATALKKGQIVISLGNPYAIARDGQVSAAWGIVSNLGRKAGPMPGDAPSGDTKPTLHHYGTLIQTDARLNLGTSGGPLLNLKGEMVGLTTAQAAMSGYEQSAGYAIPVDETFKRAVEALKLGREVEYGFLGIAPANLAQQEIAAGLRGMRVTNVFNGTPAARYGLRQDDVVVAVDGQPIFDVDGLMLNVGKLPVEAVTRLTVWRHGLTTSVEVELAKFPVKARRIVSSPSPQWRGATVDYATAMIDVLLQRGRFDGFPFDAGSPLVDACVAVTSVATDSPAWNGGLRPGMLVTHVGNSPVQTPREFHEAVAGRDGEVELRFASDLGEYGRRTTRTVPAPVDYAPEETAPR
jgi:serine protease Do